MLFFCRVLISVLYSIRVGSTYPDSGGLFVPVSQVYQEPRFDQWNFDYDISVLKLSTTLTFGPTIAPIRLPVSGENVNSGVLATVTGWGNQIEGEPNSDQLRVVQVPLVSEEECRKLYGSSADITDRMFCAGFPEGGKDACQVKKIFTFEFSDVEHIIIKARSFHFRVILVVLSLLMIHSLASFPGHGVVHNQIYLVYT